MISRSPLSVDTTDSKTLFLFGASAYFAFVYGLRRTCPALSPPILRLFSLFDLLGSFLSCFTFLVDEPATPRSYHDVGISLCFISVHSSFPVPTTAPPIIHSHPFPLADAFHNRLNLCPPPGWTAPNYSSDTSPRLRSQGIRFPLYSKLINRFATIQFHSCHLRICCNTPSILDVDVFSFLSRDFREESLLSRDELTFSVFLLLP